LRIGIGLAGLALGGCQLNALDLAASMRARGHEVRVFAVHDEPIVSVLPVADKLGLPVEVLPQLTTTAGNARSIRRFLKANRLQVLHGFGPWMAAPMAVAAAPGACAVLVTNWNMHHVRGLPPLIPLVVGTEELQQTARHAGPVWLLEPPVDTRADVPAPSAGAAFRRSMGIAETADLVVVVSRVDRAMKAEGIRNAMHALGRCARRDVHLVVVGDGDALQDLRATAERVNDDLRRCAVHLVGSMQDPAPAYAAADLVLAMGGAALRALAFERPLVVLGEQGFSSAFTEQTRDHFTHAGFYGRGTPAGQDAVHLLSAAIDTMLDPDVRLERGRWGGSFVRDRYGLERATDLLVDYYEQALAHANRPRNSINALTALGRASLGRTPLRTVRDRARSRSVPG
jgi:glycosyltransferase involved in cell wall biosynthesis